MASHESSRNASPQMSYRTLFKRVPSGNSLSSLQHQHSFKRVPSGNALSSLQHSHVRSSSIARASLIGRIISVPYSLIIDDDHSGCTCESVVYDKGSRGYLVVLAGEKLWKSESFIRQWLCPTGQHTPTAFMGGEDSGTNALPLADADDLTAHFHTAINLRIGIDCTPPLDYSPPPPLHTSPPQQTPPPRQTTSPPLSTSTSETLSRVPTADGLDGLGGCEWQRLDKGEGQTIGGLPPAQQNTWLLS